MKINSKRITLLELMSAIAIVGIVATAASYAYSNYMQKARHDEIIRATRAYQVAITRCMGQRKTRMGCNQNTHSIPRALHHVGHIASVSVTNGIITARAVKTKGLNKRSVYRLHPHFTLSHKVIWKASRHL